MTDPCGRRCAQSLDFPIVMAFQPIVDAETRRIVGYEALVRGRDGAPAAEVLARITDETLYAFDQACRVAAIRSAAELGLDRRLSINFLPHAIYSPEACLRLTLAAARAAGLPTERITFEFTENQQVVDHARLREIVETYSHHGFRTALDDFGAGFAGLSMLAEFRPDVLKLDRALTDGVDGSAARRAIVEGVMLTARRLGLEVIAEGVERAEDYRALRGLGVRQFQGYLFARPQLGRLVADDEIAWPD